MTAPNSPTGYTLVLGGGGMRGLAHIGVLEALAEAGFPPQDVIGSSVGALVAAAWCAGMGIPEMKEIARALERADLFQVAHRQMALKRMRSPSLYRPEPLAHFVTGVIGDLTFDELSRSLLVNTVDINTGGQVLWGLPGLRGVPVAETVIASCALPGFLPPHRIGDRYFVDGAAAANLPIQVAASRGCRMVLAVDVGGRRAEEKVEQRGFAAVYARSIELGIQRMDEAALRGWQRPPLVLLRPPVWDVPLLSFQHNAELLTAGYATAREWLTRPTEIPSAEAAGIFPVHRYRVRVDRAACVGCGVCATAEPDLFALDESGKAIVTEPEPLWTPVDGLVVRRCPVGAIHAERANSAGGA